MNDTYGQLIEKVATWGREFILLTPNLVVAILVVTVFWLVARTARKTVRNLMDPMSSAAQVDRMIATISYLIIHISGVFVALGILGMQKTVTTFLAGAGIIGLALGFAFQDLGANLISGVYMSLRRIFTIGDLVCTNGYVGKVKQIDLRSTTLTTLDGREVVIPNKQIFENPIENYTSSGRRRVDLAVGISYAEDLDHAESIALEAVREIQERDQSLVPELFYEEFGESSINFVIRFWIASAQQSDFLRARHEAVKRVKNRFDQHRITIPFPIRTLDFGIKGGESLMEVLDDTTLLTRR